MSIGGGGLFVAMVTSFAASFLMGALMMASSSD
jgi:hypothetical protein